MTRLALIFFLSCASLTYPITPAELLQQQLPRGADNYLRNRVPFLQAGRPVPENNVYSVTLENPADNYEAFTRLTGFAMPQTAFIASWYVFERAADMPGSLTEIINTVNQKKPAFYGQMVKLNGLWRGQANLSYGSLNPEAHVVVYLSVINRNGVLVPVGSQSFYKDPIEGVSRQEQSAGVNLDLVRFWYDQGYFAYDATQYAYE